MVTQKLIDGSLTVCRSYKYHFSFHAYKLDTITKKPAKLVVYMQIGKWV